MTEIHIDIKQATIDLVTALDRLSQKNINLSIYRSINSALSKSNTAAVRYIIERYNLKRASVANRFKKFLASPARPYTGTLRVNNKPFPMSEFNPRMIRDGVATGRFGGGRTWASKKVGGLRANKSLIKNGLIIQIIRGEDKVINSAYLAFRSGRQQTSVSAQGRYGGGSGFEFNQDEKAKSLYGVGPGSGLRSGDIPKNLQAFASNEYVKSLEKELQKRIKNIASYG